MEFLWIVVVAAVVAFIGYRVYLSKTRVRPEPTTPPGTIGGTFSANATNTIVGVSSELVSNSATTTKKK